MDSTSLLMLGVLAVVGIVLPVVACVDIASKPAADSLAVGPSKAAVGMMIPLTGGVGAAWWFLITRKRVAATLRTRSARQ